MAYLRQIEVKCALPGCDKKATVELINRHNAPMGHFCKKHGEWSLKRQLENEK